MSHLAREIETGAGAVLTEEAIASGGMREMLVALQNQPAWSDLPIVLLTRGGAAAAGGDPALRSLTNVTLLERPAPIQSVVMRGAVCRSRAAASVPDSRADRSDSYRQ